MRHDLVLTRGDVVLRPLELEDARPCTPCWTGSCGPA